MWSKWHCALKKLEGLSSISTSIANIDLPQRTSADHLKVGGRSNECLLLTQVSQESFHRNTTEYFHRIFMKQLE